MGVGDVSKRILLGRKLRSNQLGETLLRKRVALPVFASDALSSVGALIGIAGARLGYPILDSVASLVICIFIVKAAVDIFKDSIDKMVDRSSGEETEELLRECAARQKGVLGVDL
ncbi:MAG: cation transporter, partial [Nocardioides sp.]|uniref:cation transporter n=1 Tax=Nocardioides sp. TaxID=35761 RepID=UPI003F032FF2